MTEPVENVAADARSKLRKLELDVTRRLDGLLHGDHKGLVPGHGSELGETRRYQPGDDIRRIDWNVTARLPEAYIRQTIAERELESWVVVDSAPRLGYGSGRREKRDLALAAAASVGFLTQRDGNRLGAVLTGPRGEKVIAPRGSRKHLLHVLHQVGSARTDEGAGVTDLSTTLARLGSIAKRRGLIAVISDFRVQPGWEAAMGVLARRHDVIACELVDPLELELPNVGLLPVVDPGTGVVVEVPTHKAKVRDAYAAAARERRARLNAHFRRHGIDHIEMRTDHDWLDDVVRFVAQRKHRLLSTAGRRR
ncbi:MAG: DUF58 domain-containing protein [Acidimicrobiales bacterium]|nr:DUF58 domain-containing protein [Acidimicrobiales bacterium]